MKRLKYLLLSAAVVLGSCHDRALTAARCAALTSEKAIVARCMGGDVHGGKGTLADTDCFPFSAPVRMRGIRWLAFERSKFFPDATRSTAGMWTDYSTWVEEAPDFTSDVARADDSNNGAFVVEFGGRRSLCPYHYGHMGDYPNEVIIDHLISSKKLPVAPFYPATARHR